MGGGLARRVHYVAHRRSNRVCHVKMPIGTTISAWRTSNATTSERPPTRSGRRWRSSRASPSPGSTWRSPPLRWPARHRVDRRQRLHRGDATLGAWPLHRRTHRTRRQQNGGCGGGISARTRHRSGRRGSSHTARANHTAERRYAEAASLFDAALSREPFNATAAYGLATALVCGGQRTAGEAAMARFQALRDNPASITYSNNYLEQGRYGEALASTGLDVEVDPAAPPACFVDDTVAVFGENDPHGRVTLFDTDRDGDLDAMLASSGGLTLLINDEGRFARRRTIDPSVTDSVGAVTGDYDNDGRPDVFVLRRAANRLFRQQPDGSFNPMPLNAGGAGPTDDPAAAEFGHRSRRRFLVFLSAPNRFCATTATVTFIAGGETVLPGRADHRGRPDRLR